MEDDVVFEVVERGETEYVYECLESLLLLCREWEKRAIKSGHTRETRM
jgi:hypothetical protein